MAIDYAARRAAALVAATKALAASPTAEAKATERRARNAIAAANRRMRLSSDATVRAAAPALRAPVRYRPPRTSGIVEHAQAVAAAQRERRESFIASLPDVRNPLVNLRVGERESRALPERKTRKGRQRQAEAIRENAAAKRLQAVGRARQQQLRTELRDGPQFDRLADTMTPRQQRQFQRLSEIIASGSQQSTAILFDYAGGQGDYSAALERILASPESRDVEEGLAMLEALADRAKAADRLYSPKALGYRITI